MNQECWIHSTAAFPRIASGAASNIPRMIQGSVVDLPSPMSHAVSGDIATTCMGGPAEP